MKITDDRIREIEKAEKAATEGPWRADDEYIYDATRRLAACNGRRECENATFIALARTAIPELLAERKEREREIERLEGEVEQVHVDATQDLADAARLSREAMDALTTRAETAESENAALKEQIGEVREAHKLPPIPFEMVVNMTSRKAGAWERIDAILTKKASE